MALVDEYYKLPENQFESTPTVQKFYFLNPRQEDIKAYDIAHALSLQCRFGGHCADFYSVAEHSVIVAEEVEKFDSRPVTLMGALLHDAEEAYLPDIPRPIKRLMPEVQKIYKRLNKAIVRRFRLEEANWELIKNVDRRLCITEAKVLGLWHEDWESTAQYGPDIIRDLHMWNNTDAKTLFLYNFTELSDRLYTLRRR